MPGFSYIPRFFYQQWLVTPTYPTESFAGQTVIVTGSNQGLGLEAARHILRLGAEKVILAVRSIEKGNVAKDDIEKSTNRPGAVEVWQLDLQSYESVKTFAARAQKLDRLDVLLENAGISTTKFSVAEDQESTVTTNVISTFLLGLLLLPKLKESAQKFNTKPHLTIVSSEVHYFANFAERKSTDIFKALAEEKNFAAGERYWTSKMLVVLAIQQLIEKEAQTGYPVIVNHVNPGLCASSLMRDVGWAASVANIICHARSLEVGSRTLVNAASFGPESHGQYLSDSKIAPVSWFVTSAEGKETAKRVWAELIDILETIQPGIGKNI